MAQAQPSVPIPVDYVSPAVAKEVSVPLSGNARTRGLKFWMVTCFDLVQFKVPTEHADFSYMIYQVEQCPETQRMHIQGYLELKKQTTFLKTKAMFAPAVVHLEGRKARTAAPAIAYCSKEETRVSGPFEFGARPDENAAANAPKIDWTEVRTKVQAYNSWREVLASEDPDVVRATAAKLNYVKELFLNKEIKIPQPEIVLRTWQIKVLNMLREPVQKRRIIWIWSEQSGTGKSTFFDYCSTIFSVLPGADWTNTLNLYDGQSVLWYDRTRAQSGNFRDVDIFYSDIERFSNCTIHSSTKYQGGRKWVNAHVVVTANAGPDEFKLPGRFVVVEAKTKEQEDKEWEEAKDEWEAMIAADEEMHILNDNAEFYESSMEEDEEDTTMDAEEPEEPVVAKTQRISQSPSRSQSLSWARTPQRSPSPDLTDFVSYSQ